MEQFIELTQPMWLFKNRKMRKLDKPAQTIMPEEESIKKDDIRNCDTYVLKVGALLHRVTR